jgi:hypothetical protein
MNEVNQRDVRPGECFFLQFLVTASRHDLKGKLAVERLAELAG